MNVTVVWAMEATRAMTWAAYGFATCWRGKIFRLCRTCGRADTEGNRLSAFPREAAMSDSATRARLGLHKLDDRVVPSTVTETTTVRPFDFVATGTLTTTAINTSGPVAVTS